MEERTISYRCEVCTAPAPRNQPKRRHIVYRTNGQIEREIAVCAKCDKLLAEAPLGEVIARQRPKEEPETWVNEPVM